MPELMQKSGLKRLQQIEQYMLWHAMTRLNAIETFNKDDKPEQHIPKFSDSKLRDILADGITSSLLRRSIAELGLETQDLADKLVEAIIDRPISYYKIEAEEFLKTMKTVKYSNFTERLEVFFRMIDENGDGTLSFEEMYQLAYRSLNLF